MLCCVNTAVLLLETALSPQSQFLCRMNAGMPRGKALPELHMSEPGTGTAGECATVVLAQTLLW